MITFETRTDTLIMRLTDEDAVAMNDVAIEVFEKTDILVSSDVLAHYIIMRRIDKMSTIDGDYTADNSEKGIIKITFSADEIRAIDEYREQISNLIGVEIERTKAIKSLLNKGQIALGLEALFK